MSECLDAESRGGDSAEKKGVYEVMSYTELENVNLTKANE